MSKFKVGDRVLILNGHPHGGKTGEVISLDVLKLLAHYGPRPRVRLDSGEECYLTRDTNARLIERLKTSGPSFEPN